MERVKPRKRRKRINGLLIFILIMFFLDLVLAGALYGIQYYKNRPEKQLEKFCEAAYKKDWNSLYDTLNLPRDSSLNRQLFIDAKKDDVDKGLYTGFTYEEVEARPASRREPFYGDTAETRTYLVSFGRTDGRDPTQWHVTMVKTGRFLGLFDIWKVSPERFLVHNTAFTIQKGAGIRLNGFEIQFPEDSEGYWQGFGVPNLFKGYYQLEVFMEGMESYYQELNLKKNNESYVIQLSVGKEEKEKLLLQAKDDIEKILSAAMGDRNFGSVSDLFHVEVLNKDTIQKEFAALKKKGSAGEKPGMTWLEISNMTGSIEGDDTSSENAASNDEKTVTVTGTVYEKYIYKSEETGGAENAEASFPITMVCTYRRANDQWKLINMPVKAAMFK